MRFLERLEERYRDELLSLSQLVELDKGELLVRRGDRSDDLYLIQHGRLEVVDTRTTPEMILSMVGPGSMLGELSFFEGTTRTADVRATETVRCHHWSGASLKRELNANIELAAHFYKALAALASARARNMTAVVTDRTERSPVEGGEDLQKQAHALVAPVRSSWMAAEKDLRANPHDIAARKQLRTGVEMLFHEAVRWISGRGDPRLERAAGEALAKELHPFMTRSRMGALSLEGGELRRVAHVLLNEPQGSGPLGEIIDQVLLKRPSSLALRRRTELASQTLLSQLPGRPVNLMVLNVFSGVILNRLYSRLARHGADVTCIDGDREALASIDLGQASMPSSIRLKLVNTDMVRICMGRDAGQYPPQDIILVDGFVDYLPDQLAAGLMSWCRDQLRPGGRVLLTGMGPSTDALLFDHLLDWSMIRRPARNLRALADRVGLRGSVIAGNDGAVVVSATRPG